MFMVIIGVAAGAVMSVFIKASSASADPMIQKQALAIAESLLEEARMMPFTFCDPDDDNASTATAAVIGPTGCAATVETIGPEPGETRYSAATPFDNVNDYNNFVMPAGEIRDITGAQIPQLAAYGATITVTAPTAPNFGGSDARGIANAPGNMQWLLITVTVTGPNGISVTLDGIRTLYAPTI